MGSQSVCAGTPVTGETPAGEPVEVVRPGATGPGERKYFAMPDGSVAVRELRSSETAVHALVAAPHGGIEIDAAEGAARLAAGRASLARLAAAVRELEADQRAADHGALVALGLPDGLARRLSGHRPDGAG